MAGTVDFVTVDPVTSTGLDRAAGRNGDRRSARAGRASAPRPIFPDRCFWRWRRSRSNGRSGSNSDARSERPNSTIDDMLRVSGGGRFASYHHRFMFGSVASHLAETFRHQGLADLALHRLRLRRDRDPARRRSDPPRRSRCGAVRRDRRLGQSGSAGAVLAAVGAVDAERSAAGRIKAVLEEPRRFRDGGRRRRDGAGKLSSPRWRAARQFSAWSPAAAS